MKKILGLLLIFVFIFGFISINSVEAARKSSKKGPVGMSPEEVTELKQGINKLIEKTYAASLFSPEENAQIISIKMKLDSQMLVAPDPELAPLYYNLGSLLNSRKYKAEAIDSYQTILENFGDTALAPKSKARLRELGVNIKEDEPEPEPEAEEGI